MLLIVEVGSGVMKETLGQGLFKAQQPFALLAMQLERVQKDP